MSSRGTPLEDALATGIADDRVPVLGKVRTHEVSATDETVVFTEERGELLLLNDIGAGVYYLVDGRRSVAEIVAEVQRAFPDADSAHGDVVRFLGALESAGVLRFA